MRYKHFNRAERHILSVLLKRGYSQKEIAKELGKHPSSVSRELKTNKVKGQYDAKKAHHKAYVKRHNSKYQGMKIREWSWLEQYIWEKISVAGWTPEEVTGRLKLESGGKTVIGFKAIYKYLSTVYGEPLKKYLPSAKWKRRGKGKRKTLIEGRVFIDERPEIINQRARTGDFESDTLGVPKRDKTTIAGASDRASRFLLGEKIPNLKEAIPAFQEMLKPHNPLSLTLDNGVENAKYKALGIPTYFCHSYSAWEKGTMENSFQRLRRYIPKKALISNYSQEQISAIIDKMNDTPRKCLGWRTPREIFFQQPIQFTVAFSLLECCT